MLFVGFSYFPFYYSLVYAEASCEVQADLSEPGDPRGGGCPQPGRTLQRKQHSFPLGHVR